jgi:hypothetical protein
MVNCIQFDKSGFADLLLRIRFGNNYTGPA